MALLSIVTERDRDIDHDLHLIAPETARAGQVLPLRAHLYADLRRSEGARLRADRVEVELRSGARTLARARLHPAFANTLEGAIAVPPGAPRNLTLLARVAALGGPATRVERPLRIALEPAPAVRRERASVQPLQRLASGPISVSDAAHVRPNALDLQIAGGQCVPEQVCELFVHVGTPEAGVYARATASVLPDQASAEPPREPSLVRRLRVVTRGPEALFELVAERAGVVVATRSIRLEVGLGASVLAALPRVIGEGDALLVALAGGEAGCIVDAFHEDRWTRTSSLRDCQRGESLPGPPLAAGLWRLQSRRDPFDVQSAAVRTLYVRADTASDREVLTALAERVLVLLRDDPLARDLISRPEAYLSSFEQSAGYLLAALDHGVLPLPVATSGYPAALVELAVKRARVRRLALATLLLGALCLALLVARRGLAGAEQAEQLMSDAGEEPRRLQRQRVRRTLEVLLAVLAVLLVFAAIAAYIVARS